MNFRILSNFGLQYLHESQIQHKPGTTETIYKINDDKKLKDMEEKTNKNTKEENNPSFIVKSVPVMNRKEKDENGDINTKITSTKQKFIWESNFKEGLIAPVVAQLNQEKKGCQK